tara:strand:+ start:4382 stop:4630 length:249 start_codon:yes stop_codon:yes gene_type:complete
MSACNNNPCPSNRFRLPCGHINILNEPLRNPTGVWADFNTTAARFRYLQEFSHDRIGKLCDDDVADAPLLSNYSDLNSAATR